MKVYLNWIIVCMAVLMSTFSARVGWAQGLQNQIYKGLNSIRKPVERLEAIDAILAGRAAGNMSEDQRKGLLDLRALDCEQARQRCMAISQWVGNICRSQSSYESKFLDRLMKPVFQSLKTEGDANALLTEIDSCSKLLTVAKSSLLADLYVELDSRGWVGPKRSLLRRLTAALEASPDIGSVVGSGMSNAVDKIFQRKPIPLSSALDLESVLFDYILGRGLKKVERRHLLEWVRTLTRIYSETGNFEKLNSAIEHIPSVFAKNLSVPEENRLLNLACKFARETGKPQRCIEILDKVYVGDRKAEIGREFQQALNLYPEGKWQEYNNALVALNARAKKEGGDLVYSLPIYISTGQLELGQVVQAQASLDSYTKRLESSGSTSPLDLLWTVDLKMKILMRGKRFAEAWQLVEEGRPVLEAHAGPPFFQRQLFEYTALLVAVGLKDRAKIESSLKRARRDLTGDSSESYRVLVINIIENRLNKKPDTAEMAKLESMKGYNHPLYNEFQSIAHSL